MQSRYDLNARIDNLQQELSSLKKEVARFKDVDVKLSIKEYLNRSLPCVPNDYYIVLKRKFSWGNKVYTYLLLKVNDMWYSTGKINGYTHPSTAEVAAFMAEAMIEGSVPLGQFNFESVNPAMSGYQIRVSHLL